MRVKLGTVAVGYAERRAIREFFGQTGFATASEVRQWLVDHAMADLQTHTSECAENPSEEEFYIECYEMDRKARKGRKR